MLSPPKKVEVRNEEEITRLKSENAELKAGILGDCGEVFEFGRTPQGSTNNSRSIREGKQQNGNSSSTGLMFDPYYSLLSS